MSKKGTTGQPLIVGFMFGADYTGQAATMAVKSLTLGGSPLALVETDITASLNGPSPRIFEYGATGLYLISWTSAGDFDGSLAMVAADGHAQLQDVQINADSTYIADARAAVYNAREFDTVAQIDAIKEADGVTNRRRFQKGSVGDVDYRQVLP